MDIDEASKIAELNLLRDKSGKSPELYKHANGLQRRDALEMLSEYLHLVQWRSEDESILDVGCGSGDVTCEILQPRLPRTVRVVGADVSSDMVAYAAKRYPGAEFIALDVAVNKVPEQLKESFDHVFSVYCLHWVKNQRQAMQNIYKVLKPGGDILMCYLASNPIYDVYLNMAKSAQWKSYMRDLHKYISPYHFIKDVEGSLRKILTDAGFEIIVCECKKKMFEYENLNLVRKAVIAVNPFYSKLPDNLKDQFINDYIKELSKLKLLEENNNSKSEIISMPYRLITICVKKPILTPK